MKVKLHTEEIISHATNYVVSSENSRMAVPGGWIYTLMASLGRGVMTSVFVPDPNVEIIYPYEMLEVGE